MKKQHNTETIIDESGIELIAAYEYGREDDHCKNHEPTLTSVEIVIAGRGIDILPVLTPNQKDELISKLNYQ